MKAKLFLSLIPAAILAAGVLPATAQESTTKEPMTKAPTVTPPSATDKAAYSTMQAADQWRSTMIVGLNVYNQANEKIGDINDLILDNGGKAVSAVIGVGGFLGIGEKSVAVPFADLKFERKSDGSIGVMHNSTKEALKAAPTFTYFGQQTKS